MEILLKIKFPHFKQEIQNDEEQRLEGDNKLCKNLVKNQSQSPTFMRIAASTKIGMTRRSGN